MGVNFDRWTFLKLIEVIFVIICLAFKRVTDDEAFRLYLYLQKISREWRLLNNITWSRVGASVADVTCGGYLIITGALFIGRLVGELPTHRRVTELILLGIGSILFIVLGSLSFAALDSVPENLVDNAAIVGTFALVTGALFLLDILGGPKGKKPLKVDPKAKKISKPKPTEAKSIPHEVHNIEKEIQKSERTLLDSFEPSKGHKENKKDGVRNGKTKHNGVVIDVEGLRNMKGYQQMKDDFPRTFGIYGKDVVDHGGSETDDTEDIRLPPKMERHSPVWSNIRKGHYGKYDIISAPITFSKQKEREERPPSSPGDPGYVQYTAQHWGEIKTKTPRHSPTEV